MNAKRTGKFLGVPYDWRRPTWTRYKSRWWNPEERRIITPRAFGWGYDFNLYEVGFGVFGQCGDNPFNRSCGRSWRVRTG